MDARVTVTIRDEEITGVFMYSHVSRSVEHCTGLLRGRIMDLADVGLHLFTRPQYFTFWAEHHQSVSFRIALGNDVGHVVHEPDVILVIDCHRMWTSEFCTTPSSEFIPIRICICHCPRGIQVEA